MRLLLFLLPLSLPASEILTPQSTTLVTGTEFFPAANLTNRSGLSSVPTIDNYGTVTHTAASGSTAWTTNAPGGGAADYFSFGPAPVFRFHFDEIHQFSDLVYWGYHFGNPNGNEGKSFRLEFSEDGGATYGNPVEVTASAISRASATTLPLGGIHPGNAIRLTITDNWFENFGGGDRVGIGEFRFIGETPIDPVPAIAVARLLDFGIDPVDSTRILTVTNEGSRENLIITPTLEPGGGFSVPAAPFVIPAGASAELAIAFTPSGDGCFSQSLRLMTNDPAHPEVRVALLGAVNCASATPEKPEFSHPEGTFTETFALTLSSENGTTLLYTLDGSRPDRENGLVYEGAVTIESSTQIRVASYFPGQPPAIRSRSYVRLASDLASYSSALPIMVIENFGAGAIPNKGWSTGSQTGGGLTQVARQPAFFSVFERDAIANRADFQTTADQTSRIGIRVRGAFSSTWSPKPYSMETWKTDGNDDRAIRILGMASESDWVLYYPHPNYDRTMLYNTFIWELSRQTGRWAPEFRFVDLFVNEDGGDLSLSDRRGVYAFLEKPKRDDKRLEFDELSKDGSTGGWLNSINRMDPAPVGGFPAENGATSPQFFHTAGPDRTQSTPANLAGRGDDIPRQYNAFINFENPNGYRINPAQRSAIEAWYRNFEDVLYDDTRWRDPEEGYRKHLDTTDFIDYLQMLTLAKQGDGLLLSMFPWVSSHDRKLRMGPMWDFNNGAYGGSTTGTLYFRPDRLWYGRLFDDPDFQREYEDRWFELRKGPLSNSKMAGIIDRQVAEITPGLADAQAGLNASIWTSRVNAMKSWLQARANWIDSNFLPPPSFSIDGGIVSDEFALVISNTTGQSGTIYYTLDGRDPINLLTAYSGPISPAESTEIRARVRTTSGAWSALQKATFVVGTPAGPTNLAVSEINYHPDDDHPATEFIELLNISPDESIDLTGVAFTAGISFVFPTNTILAPGQRTLVVQNREAMLTLHGNQINIAGEFADLTRLSNSGEQLVLSAADGSVIVDFEYNDKDPWPELADGEGCSLTLIRPESGPDLSRATHWRCGATLQGSPGLGDTAVFPGPPDRLIDFALGGIAPQVTSRSFGFAIRVGMDDFVVTPESSPDLDRWTPLPLPLQPVSIDLDGFARYQLPLTEMDGGRFMRLRIIPRP